VSRAAGYPYVNSLLTEESVMGIAWVVLGLVAGLFANLLSPGKTGHNGRSRRRRTGWAHQ
jgi:hypothetical protein